MTLFVVLKAFPPCKSVDLHSRALRKSERTLAFGTALLMWSPSRFISLFARDFPETSHRNLGIRKKVNSRPIWMLLGFQGRVERWLKREPMCLETKNARYDRRWQLCERCLVATFCRQDRIGLTQLIAILAKMVINISRC